MSETVIIPVVVLVMFLLLFGGNWVFVALSMAGMLAMFLLGYPVLSAVALQVWCSIDSFILTAVPLFIFMGEIMLHSGLANVLYTGIATWLGRLPGGLLHANVGACAIFAAISGSSIATAATIGTVAIPELEKRGYDRKLILGSLASAGTLGILIPPSITMIIYGAWVECSIAQLFIGGIIPGIILAVMFSAFLAIRCHIGRDLAPREKFSWGERFSSLRDMGPTLLLPLFIVVSIYTGIMSPTETAAVSAAAALAITFALRRFSWQLLSKASINAARTSAMILIIYLAAKILVMGLFYLEVTTAIGTFVESLNLPNIVILVIIYGIFLILGCFFDAISLMMVTLPFVFPLIVAMEINVIWFGIVMTILIEIGLITPPVGMNLYVILSLVKNGSFGEIVRAILPFFFLMLLGVALLTIFPQLALWLPNMMVK